MVETIFIDEENRYVATECNNQRYMRKILSDGSCKVYYYNENGSGVHQLAGKITVQAEADATGLHFGGGGREKPRLVSSASTLQRGCIGSPKSVALDY